jgi:F-type H+-transporting ATPase subunit delta
MPEPGLARRYAAALFETAKARKLVDRVEADLQATVELLSREPALREFLLSPQVLDEHKEEIVNHTLGPRLSPLVVDFIHLLLKKRRFDHLDEIHASLIQFLDEHRGIVKAAVTTSIELKPELRDKLRARLERTTGKTVRLECGLDPGIVGGIVVVLGDQLLDASVRREVERLRDELMATRVI